MPHVKLSATPDFAEIQRLAGTKESTGYIGLSSSGRLTKVAAHRTLTGKNEAELARASSQQRQNQYVRSHIFAKVEAGLSRQVDAGGMTAEQSQRMLRFAAKTLGLREVVDENGSRFHPATDVPLERRTVRDLLRKLDTPQLHTVLLDTTLDAGTGPDALANRQKLLSVMMKHFRGVQWKELPISQLSNASLRKMGEHIFRGELRTMRDVRDFCAEMAKNDQTGKINSINTLQRLAHARTADPNLVTFANAAPGNPQNPPAVQGNPDPQPAEQGGKPDAKPDAEPIKEPPQKAPSMATEAELDGLTGFWFFPQKMAKLQAILNGTHGEAEQVVADFIQAAIATASKPDGDFKALLMNNRRALAVLLCATDQRRSEILKSVPFGAMLEEQVTQMRSSVGQMLAQLQSGSSKDPEAQDKLAKAMEKLLCPASIGLVYDKMTGQLGTEGGELDEMIGQMGEALRQELRPEALARVNAKLAAPKDLMDKLRSDLALAIKAADGQPAEKGIWTLLGAVDANLEAVTALLTHTDEVLPYFGDVPTLKPFIDGIKAAIGQKLGGGMQGAGCFAPEFAGRVYCELSDAFEELFTELEDGAENNGALQKYGTPANMAIFAGLAAGVLSASSASEEIRAAQQARPAVSGQDVRNMLADFVLETDTWISDNAAKPGERMKAMVGRHLDTLAAFLCDPVKFAEQEHLPESILAEARAMLEAVAPLGLLLGPGNEGFARVALGKAFASMTLAQFAHLEERISEATRKTMKMVQVATGHAFEALLKGENIGDLFEIFDGVDQENRQVALWKKEGKSPEEIEQLLASYRENAAFERSLRGLTPKQAEEKRLARIEEQNYQAQLSRAPDEEARTAVRLYRKMLLEARFVTSLDSMEMDKALDAWAFRNFYDKPSRAALRKAFFAQFPDKHAAVAAFRGADTFTAKLEAFIADNNLRLTKFKDPAQMTPQEKAVWKLQEAELKDIAGAGALDTTQGYGKFMVEVMKKYFGGVSELDQRSMLSSLLRQGRFEPIPENASEQQAGKIEQDNIARQLGALFKGAGPIMQKLLQQLGSLSISDEFKLALDDMKSNLLPIPKEVIHAQLVGIAERYNAPEHLNADRAHPLPAITNINVDKNLGAASVGQTLLCTLTFADGTHRRVAVKLLRPDVENRINREKEIFLDVAHAIPGMEKTYQGRLDRLMEEVDLRIEAANVTLGSVYDRSLKLEGNRYRDVHSMKVDAQIPPTRSAMVLECAPGTNVAEYLNECSQKLADLKARADQMALTGTNVEVVKEIDDLLADMMAKQKQLTHLSYKWVEQGLFKSGFYHGDLHAGNIMVDNEKPNGVDRGMTVIDFGNATSLKQDDQKRIMRMVYAAGDGNADLFLDNYRALLKPDSLAQFDAVRADARARLAVIFSKGGEKDIGERILGAMTELQKFNLEMPAQIFNFSQCQILLQGTLDKVNSQIDECVRIRCEVHNRNSPMVEPEPYMAQTVFDAMVNLGRTPESLQKLSDQLDRDAAKHRKALVALFKTDKKLSQYLNAETLGGTVAADRNRAKNLTAGNLDMRVARAAINAYNADLNRQGDLQTEPLKSAIGYLGFLESWQARKPALGELAQLVELTDRTRQAEALRQKYSQQLIGDGALRSALERIPADLEIPVQDLSLGDPELAKLLKGKETHQAMLDTLAAEENRLKGLDKPTDKDQRWFQKVHDFAARLKAAPQSWVPRPPLPKVQSILNGLYDMVMTKGNVTAKFQELKAQAEEKQRQAEEKSRRSFATEENVRKLNEALEAFKKQNETADKNAQFANWTNPLLMKIRAAQDPVSLRWSPLSNPPTKAQIIAALEGARNSTDAILKDIKKAKDDIARYDAALKELSETGWSDGQLLEKTPDLPKYVLDELQRTGQKATQKNVYAIVMKQYGEHKVLDNKYRQEANDLNVRLYEAGGYNDWTAFADKYADAERVYHEANTQDRVFEAHQGFLEVMGDVVDAHKIQAGWSVGVGTAIKAMFS